ncbi:hypothetical protein CVT24_003480 [Panaeolus cyanescens]|uniref:RNA exonuclease 4 n=1 Tax=Panaeolus cyanescens TaxID=181874 RepID=A0A409Y7R3_9AGAR|nr:hypothetical protein CVT24_003480 [Panaeolus cyanescens]
MPSSSSSTPSKGKAVASSNWLLLQKKLKAEEKQTAKTTGSSSPHASKKRKFNHEGSTMAERSVSPSTSRLSQSVEPHAKTVEGQAPSGMGELKATMQQMVLGHLHYSEAQKQPGKYLAMDCEMVGVGIDGAESSLARVSLINFYGAVILDEFVRQKERVVDYRTQWSGIRETDMINAKPFEEVQKKVAELLKDKILIGHAVHNDLKALLLSHPRPLTRDTQFYAYRFELTKSKRIALRNLVKEQLGLTIQSGEHSSVTDARATMAIYRLHKTEWEKNSRHLHNKTTAQSLTSSSTSSKRKRTENPDDDSEDDSDSSDDDAISIPINQTNSASLSSSKKGKARASGGGEAFRAHSNTQRSEKVKKGISSGLSTVVRKAGGEKEIKGRKGAIAGGAGKKSGGSSGDWWKQLPGGVAKMSMSKGSISIGRKG